MKKMMMLVLIIATICLGCGKKDTDPPRVVTTDPVNGSVDVDPAITEISVTFNEAMTNQWSWCTEDKETFPQTTGSAYYEDGNTKNILPVKLQPGKEYVMWINLGSHNNFKDKSGNPVVPFKFSFKTK